MPRQRIHHSRITYVFPDDFPRRLELFKEEACLSWVEISRRIGTYPLTIRRWRSGVRPNAQHLMALLDIAEDLGLAHLLTTHDVPGEARQPIMHANERSTARPDVSLAVVDERGTSHPQRNFLREHLDVPRQMSI